MLTLIERNLQLLDDKMNTIVIIIIFFVFQFILSYKCKNKLVEYLPMTLIFVGLLFCFITYLSVWGIKSQSVIAENQYFAVFLSHYLFAALLGIVIGILFSKYLKKAI